jgi:hypothetical protein
MTPYQFGIKMAGDLNSGIGAAMNAQLGKMWKAPPPKPAQSAPQTPAQLGGRAAGAASANAFGVAPKPAPAPAQAAPARPTPTNDHYYLPKDQHGFAYGPRGGKPAYAADPRHFRNSEPHAAYLNKVRKQYPKAPAAAVLQDVRDAQGTDAAEQKWQGFVNQYPVE